MIGGGQAGLAMGYLLAREGRHVTILEASDAVGAAWRGRWNSLVLFTPRRYDSLPGLPFPGDPDGYPGRDEVVDYLESYASTFELPVQLNSSVQAVVAGRRKASPSISAVGLSRPIRLWLRPARSRSRMCPRSVRASRRTSSRCTARATGDQSDVPQGTVVVVGGGNTGFQIAKELSATHSAHLAIGTRQTPLPQRLLGRDLFWWLTRTGLIKEDGGVAHRTSCTGPRHADRLEHTDVKRHGVEVKPRVVGVSGAQ